MRIALGLALPLSFIHHIYSSNQEAIASEPCLKGNLPEHLVSHLYVGSGCYMSWDYYSMIYYMSKVVDDVYKVVVSTSHV